MFQRTLLHHCVPGGDSTGIHYDKVFLRGGSAYFLTAWVPIGDVTWIGGGLYYLADSDRLGQAMEEDFSERARDFTPEERISAFNENMASVDYLADHPDAFVEEHKRVAEKEGVTHDRYDCGLSSRGCCLSPAWYYSWQLWKRRPGWVDKTEYGSEAL